MAELIINRTELLNIKNRLDLAKVGHKLLEDKRKKLSNKLMELLEKNQDFREEMLKKYKESVEKMKTLRVFEYDRYIKSSAYAIKNKPSLKISIENIMGVFIPEIKEDNNIKKETTERGIGIAGTDGILTETATCYEELVESIINVAAIETTILRLLDEIERTKRREKALEDKIIPDLKKDIAFIKFRLEEQDRESIFIRKLVKKKKIAGKS